MIRLFAVALMLLASACASAPPPAVAPARDLTILISIDGFRADYLGRGVTPTLSRMAHEGVTGPMRPSFPSVTFPNHYTLVTGKHPDHHGIVGNAFVDPVLGRFTMASKEPGFWDQAEPIWITAEKAGLTTATMFWPGSETELQGERPTHWAPFDQTVTGDQRVDRLLGWLDSDPRPDLATLYFDIVDSAGHQFGPDAPETDQAAASVDRSIARLIAGLESRGLRERTNLIVVADHGMAQISPDRVIRLADLIDPAAIQVLYVGAVVYLEPAPGREAEVVAALVKRHPHGGLLDAGDDSGAIGPGLQSRVPSIVCAADVGWMFVHDRPVRSGGAHGYDNAAAEMRAVFVAHGPAFGRGMTLDDLDSVDVQPLLGRLLGIAVPPGDGRAEDTRAAMAR